jgi:beta-galactosidase
MRVFAVVIILAALFWGADNAGVPAPRSGIAIDASKAPPAPQSLGFEAGGRSPDGHVLAINSRYLVLDNKPWFPVMGEFHYSRYPASEWEEEILKMKAGGIRIVSSYVFWIHHEEVEGAFDWSGQRDLRKFVELCGKHGLYVWVRVGPWAHGEARNGGLPDWLLQKSAVRQNDPAYLKYVGRFFGEIGGQIKGLFWKDGGPIVGVQIENEYHDRGTGKGTEHILTLKQMARAAGLEAPFYTITGWDNAAVPEKEVVPVFGGYAEQFWARSRKELPPNPNYFFTPIRCEENVGPDLRSQHPEIDARQKPYPFLTAEMGGGMELAYHRRPLMAADDTAAMTLVKLGAGVTLYGYYMFHGGTNPDGKLTTLQESQATGYPQDMRVKSYDFQAPLNEFGQMNPSFRDLKSLHLFLNDFGSDLARMAPAFPDKLPEGRQDTATPRASARIDGTRGFIFLNNYQRNYPLPERKQLQVRLKLAGGSVDVPKQPIDLPSGAYTFWPVNLDVGGATLDYATAQPLCRLDNPGTVVFFAWPGIAPEFAFRTAEGLSVEAPHARVRREDGRVYVDRIVPGTAAAIQVRKAGASVQILVLSREQARNSWKATVAGRERLILSPADIFFEGDTVHLRSTDPARLTLGIFPQPAGEVAGLHYAGRDGIFERYTSRVQPVTVSVDVRKQAEAGEVPPVKMGKEVAMAPVDADFGAAARWSIRVSSLPGGPVRNVFLHIAYMGDVARLYTGDALVTDDFFKGTAWEIGLRRLAPEALAGGLELKILPLRQDAPIYLPAGARPSFASGSQVAALKEVRAIPEYEAAGVLKR